jgi:hypothetical protein
MGGPNAMDLAQQLFIFRRGLLKSIRVYVDLKEPATLEDAMRIAQRYEAEEYVGRVEDNAGRMNNNNQNRFTANNKFNKNRNQHFTGSYGNHSNHTAAGGGNGFGGGNSGAAPMDLNNIRRVDGEEDDLGGSGVDDEDQSNDHDRSGPSQRESVNFVNQSTRVVNLSKEEFQRCFKAGICFKCKRHGHLARDCKATQQQQSKK